MAGAEIGVDAISCGLLWVLMPSVVVDTIIVGVDDISCG